LVCASPAAAQAPAPSPQSGAVRGAASGEAIYRERCAGCHDLTNARIPRRDALKLMPASRILRALDFGVMMNVAYPMRRDEREAVATFLGSGASDPKPLAQAYCADRTIRLASRPKCSGTAGVRRTPTHGFNLLTPPASRPTSCRDSS
jgi:polyvinyl alcohol dehydrogenase (cytochrome)